MKKFFCLLLCLNFISNCYMYGMEKALSKEEINESKIQPLLHLTAIVLAKQKLVDLAGTLHFKSKDFALGIQNFIGEAISDENKRPVLQVQMKKLKEFKQLLKNLLGKDVYLNCLIDSALLKFYSVRYKGHRFVPARMPYDGPYAVDLEEDYYYKKLRTPLMFAGEGNAKAAKIILEMVDDEMKIEMLKAKDIKGDTCLTLVLEESSSLFEDLKIIFNLLITRLEKKYLK